MIIPDIRTFRDGAWAEGPLPKIRAVRVNIFPPRGHKNQTRIFPAPDGQLYSVSGIKRTVATVAEWLDKEFPMWKFAMEAKDKLQGRRDDVLVFDFHYDGETVKRLVKVN